MVIENVPFEKQKAEDSVFSMYSPVAYNVYQRINFIFKSSFSRNCSLLFWAEQLLGAYRESFNICW